MELTDAQIERIDDIHNAVHDCLKVLLEDESLEWDMHVIGEVTDAIEYALEHNLQLHMRYPAIQHNGDGTEEYVE